MKSTISVLKISMILLIFVTMTSEKCSKEDTKGSKYTAETMVVMSKTTCFGKCPAYTITIDGTGAALYKGKMFVEKEGEYIKSFTVTETTVLLDAFAEADFWSFEKEYTADITDLPTTYLTFKHDGKEKKIRMYYEVPKKLKELEALVVAMAESEGWEKK